VEHLGITDSVFKLGADSLQTVRVISRIASALGVELPLNAVFDAPTVEQLSALIDALHSRNGLDGSDMTVATHELRERIGTMSDADVLSRIATLERELLTDVHGATNVADIAQRGSALLLT
jgi:hypothetical protein